MSFVLFESIYFGKKTSFQTEMVFGIADKIIFTPVYVIELKKLFLYYVFIDKYYLNNLKKTL
jgi:hypothetical protein